jgi:hypothetical protein
MFYQIDTRKIGLYVKQGLKHTNTHNSKNSFPLREAHPLKQGLKHGDNTALMRRSNFPYCRTASIKTRIETP